MNGPPRYELRLSQGDELAVEGREERAKLSGIRMGLVVGTIGGVLLGGLIGYAVGKAK